MEDTPKRTQPRPRPGWQRVTPKQSHEHATRETFRRDAPSPVQEILAKHDAELDDQAGKSDDESSIIHF